MNVSIAAYCCWPNCEAAPSSRIEGPICDRHAVTTYRRVADLIATTPDITRTAVVAHMPRAPKAVRRETQGNVYFVRFGDRIKIGFSTNVHERMKAVPHDHIIHTIPGSMSLERQLHHKFRALRITGEWFKAEQPLTDYIDQMKASS